MSATRRSQNRPPMMTQDSSGSRRWGVRLAVGVVAVAGVVFLVWKARQDGPANPEDTPVAHPGGNEGVAQRTGSRCHHCRRGMRKGGNRSGKLLQPVQNQRPGHPHGRPGCHQGSRSRPRPGPSGRDCRSGGGVHSIRREPTSTRSRIRRDRGWRRHHRPSDSGPHSPPPPGARRSIYKGRCEI